MGRLPKDAPKLGVQDQAQRAQGVPWMEGTWRPRVVWCVFLCFLRSQGFLDVCCHVEGGVSGFGTG